jgi:hypothetical protein
MAVLDSAKMYPRNRLPFPECASGCDCVTYFGVCECEAVCPHKFNLKTGEEKRVPDLPRVKETK